MASTSKPYGGTYIQLPDVRVAYPDFAESRRDGQTFKCRICYNVMCAFENILDDQDKEQRTYLGTANEVMDPKLCQMHQGLFSKFVSDTPLEERDIIVFEARRNVGESFIKIEMTYQPQSEPREFRESSNRLFLVSKDDASIYLSTGTRLDNEWINPQLPRQWKELCDQEHQGPCKDPLAVFDGIQPHWLIDVEGQCLVKPSKGDQYVALSYVWGGVRSLNTLKNNVMDLQEKMGLSVAKVPLPLAKTVRDAIEVTKLLGEKYLWVDSLCIVQDDAQLKHSEIQRMSAIYANATLTIIASGGENANTGLRGFKGITEQRKHLQRSLVLDGDHQIVSFAEVPHNEVTTYQERGWTYQADYFSRRKLIFQSDRIFWHCSEMERAEGTYEKRHYTAGIRATRKYPIDAPVLEDLSRIICEFNSRQLTFPEDSLAAFSGIAYAFSSAYPGGFISGLPVTFFDVALLWQPNTEMKRRVPKNKSVNHCLPSWSWAGWTGKTHGMPWVGAGQERQEDIGMFSPEDRHLVIPLVRWHYHYDVKTTKLPIDANWHSLRAKYRNTLEKCPSGWTRYKVPGAEVENDNNWGASWYYRHNSIIPWGSGHWYPIPQPQDLQESDRVMKMAPYISGITKSGWLYGGERISDRQAMVSIRDDSGSWIGILRLHTFSERDDIVGKRLELVEIAQGVIRVPEAALLPLLAPHMSAQDLVHPERPVGESSDEYHFYWVMYVERSGDIASRRGLGRVSKELWELQSRSTMDLILG